MIAKSGKEAIEIYEENKEQIGIVILDMIISFPGYSISGQATEIMDQGCNGFVQKPFKMKELAQKLRGVLDGK